MTACIHKRFFTVLHALFSCGPRLACQGRVAGARGTQERPFVGQSWSVIDASAAGLRQGRVLALGCTFAKNVFGAVGLYKAQSLISARRISGRMRAAMLLSIGVLFARGSQRAPVGASEGTTATSKKHLPDRTIQPSHRGEGPSAVGPCALANPFVHCSRQGPVDKC